MSQHTEGFTSEAYNFLSYAMPIVSMNPSIETEEALSLAAYSALQDWSKKNG